MPRAKQSGSLTGSKHFKKPKDTSPSTPPSTPDSTPTPEQQTDARARERLKDRFQQTAQTVGNAAHAVGNGVKAVNTAAKTVRRGFAGGSSIVTNSSTDSLKQAVQIAQQYGVGEIDIKEMLGTDPYKADADIPEMKAVDANREKLKIQRQNNALEVRHEKIKQGRKVVQIATEQRKFIGDFVDFATAGIETATKVVKNQVADTKYQIEQSKLEQTEEQLIQQQIATQGTLNLTAGIEEEWSLKFQSQQAKNDRLKLEVEGSIQDNERKREELEARLLES
ncbi:hypothetical protein [Scytonema sp. PCC 10023]|uniref:hypothetical protein n=1 Tax=Scytonema sp. PCC 10023 TaxID=1680591 RepID=UPI0039C6A641